jgi:hypothetical protein
VEASTDGQNWTMLVADSRTAPPALPAPVSARYLRFGAVANVGTALSISEVTAYGSNNTALSRPAQALFIDGTQADMQPNSVPAFGNDGDPSTFAQATGRYRWTLQVDLQHPQPIDVVSVLMPTDKYATAFHIDVSLDGSTFWTVAHRTDSAGGITGVQLDEPVTARYMRVIADRPNDGGQPGGQMAISEFAVYGGR